MAERHRHERHLAAPLPVDKGSAPLTVIHHETVSLLNPTPEEVEARYAELFAGDPVAAPADDGPPEADLPLALRLAAQRVDRELTRLVSEAGWASLTPRGWHVLRLCRFRGKPISALADQLVISRQAVSQTVAGLEEQGLVRRKPGRFTMLAVATEDGRSLVREVDDAVVDLVSQWSFHLPAERMAALAKDVDVLAERPGASWARWG